jgi:hypothetical protein
MITRIKGSLFTLILLAYAGLILFLTLQSGPLARLVPLKVVIATLFLLLLQFLLDLMPVLSQRLVSVEKKDLFRIGRVREKVQGKLEVLTERSQRARERSAFIWIMLMLAFIYVIGLLSAVPLHAFLYLKFRCKEGWKISFIISAGLWGLIYVLSINVLNTSLYEGVLWHFLGF